MLLKRLELNGFKSFSRPSTFSFQTPVTAIVGPNGSGKSNIADAIRFVLGEQSVKSLRGVRGEDLIFGGSKTAIRHSRAHVAIVFENISRTFPIDYDELEIKRVIYRGGGSQYFLNDSKVRLKDIIELFSSVHIGPSGHHILSQGETDKILNVSTAERSAMIKDALGLKVHQSKKEESLRKLSKTNENIAKVEGLRREIAPHLAFLEKQVEKVHKEKEMREELKALYHKFFVREEEHLARQELEFEESIRTPREELTGVEKEIQSIEKKLSALSQEGGAIAETTAFEESLQKISSEKDDLVRRIGRLEGLIEAGEEYLKRHSKIFPGESDRVFVDRASVNRIHDSAKKLEKEAQNERSRESLKQIIFRLVSLIQEFVVLFDKKTSDSINEERGMGREEKLKEQRKERKILSVKLKDKEKEEQEQRKQYRALRNKAQQSKNTELKLERELFNSRQRRSELLSRIELFEVRRENLASERAQLQAELEEAEAFTGFRFAGQISSDSSGGDIEEESRQKQKARKKKIERIKFKIEESDSGGEEMIKEYKETAERDRFLEHEISDLEKSAESLEKLIDDLDKKIEREFKNGVREINRQFQKMFSLVFGGGTASLKIIAPKINRKKALKGEEISALEEKAEVFKDEESGEQDRDEGINVLIDLPSKRIKGLRMLSGGERSLTSVALTFATAHVNPPPFLVLDETDATLDEANSKKYADLLNQLSKKTQFILITHNRATMAQAGVLYGVTAAADGVSRVLSVKLDEAVKMAE